MSIKCPKCNTDNPDTVKFCGECGTLLRSVRGTDPTDAGPDPRSGRPKDVGPDPRSGRPFEDIPVRTETMETPKVELTTGSTFASRYQIIEELGRGGMGRVYRVLDKELNEEVALKLIKPEIAKEKKTIERFKNELKVARKISHRNVGRMYELMEEGGMHFITMEYVPGQDLRGLIRQTGQLTTGKAIAIAKEICEGLDEAHHQGVVHRDLKPSNIIIDRQGNARILDFGIARSIAGKGITGSGVMIGTPEYMSPEQVEGRETDQRSDIYSLGIILYEMVTGRVPFEGDTPFTVGVKHKSEIPQDPQELNTQIHEDLSRVILRCLEKDKEKRYQNADEVRSELINIEKGIPTTERVVPERKPLTSREITVTFGLKKLWIPALVIIAIVITGLIIWSPWSKKTLLPITTDKPSIAVLYFRNGTGDQSLDHWREDLCDSLITDLSQSKYIRTISFDRIYSILKKNNLLEARNYSTEDLTTVAVEGRADYILQGSLSKAEDLFRIKYTLQDMKNRTSIGSDSLEGRGVESIFAMVDQLTVKIKQDLKLTDQQISDDRDMGVQTITTSSTEAYRYYRKGRDLFLRGDYRESIPLLERAVEIDPEFALAYRALSTSYESTDRDKSKEYAVNAYELREHASHEERLVIEAYYFDVVEQDNDKAISACERILEEYPDNNFANGMLAFLHTNREDWDNVIKHMSKAIETGDEWMAGFGHLGYAYEAKGMYEKARQVYMDYINNISDHPTMRAYISMNYVFEGNYEEALEAADQALALNPRGFSKAAIFHLQGDFESAEKGYRSWLEDERVDWKMSGRQWLEILYRTLGKYEKAEKEARAGLEYAEEKNLDEWKRTFYRALAIQDLAAGNLDSVLEKAEFIWKSAVEEENAGWQVNALWLKTEAYLRQNRIEEAISLVEEAKKIIDSTPSTKNVRWYYLCLGLIEMKRQDYPKAIDLFNRAYELQGGQRNWLEPHTWILINLATAYNRNGDLEAAQKEYENILALTTGRLWFGDLYVKSFYMLGKIHEQQGNTAKAIEHYEKFLDLWKDADSGIVEVEDAKKRLASLGS